MDNHEVKALEFGTEDIKIDPRVQNELPTGSRVISVVNHGISFWGKTGRIDVELADGAQQSFFIKLISKEVGRTMLLAEFESMKAIFSLVPNFVPQPIAQGTYATIPDTHFLLCQYREMIDELPDPHRFTELLALLHQKSTSPEGMFGFHKTTYMGNLPQMTEWERTWEVFFAKSLKLALKLEVEAKGHDPEFDVLVPIIFDKVIPRLLRPLETEGRSIKPSLVHGDLWFANSGIDVDTGEPLIFDACCFYAHNEYEFGQWRPVCNRFGAEYLKAYQSHCQISAPEEDYEGRLDLYKLRFNTHVSALFRENETLREQMLGDMRDLIKRYG